MTLSHADDECCAFIHLAGWQTHGDLRGILEVNKRYEFESVGQITNATIAYILVISN